MQHWFVYYKCPRLDVEALVPRMRALCDLMSRRTGARTRLMRRVEAGQDAGQQVTLMEVYEGIVDTEAFEQLLNDLVAAADLPVALLDARRVERFTDC